MFLTVIIDEEKEEKVFLWNKKVAKNKREEKKVDNDGKDERSEKNCYFLSSS